ncbi:MAG: RNA methyltransferase [Prevotellaceae bacterium]|jgi:TrmH family RNA methyltransferase|nr:RNA methyltransferase [Prevotellaceae bacterium]
MLSKATISLITSLEKKKLRDELGLFVAEGEKLVADLSRTLKVKSIYATIQSGIESAELISAAEMKKISFLKNPSSVLGVFHTPNHEELNLSPSSLVLALDDVQDPGNLGAIIRLCDWFGITILLCSTHTADCYSPKVVQATMGAIARVRVYYVDLQAQLNVAQKAGIPVFGAFLEGKNIYQESLPTGGIVVMGNEGNGISKEIASLITQKLYIPSFAESAQKSESLNVAIASAVICSEFKRRAL